MNRTAALSVAATLLVSCAIHQQPIRVWKIGSPHLGNTPGTSAAPGMSVEAFPAQGFDTVFADAVTRGSSPDLLVIDNIGIIDGITTSLGRFKGIGEDPAVRQQLLHVTGTFDGLLPPTRGWTYLLKGSRNHATAKRLALRSPECGPEMVGPSLPGELKRMVPELVTAYLNVDSIRLRTYADADRLQASAPNREPAKVGVIRSCGFWGNDKLAFVWATASYEATTTLGHISVLLALRKPASRWQVLVATDDPISTGRFVTDLRLAPLPTEPHASDLSGVQATLLYPPAGVTPTPAAGSRFGTFTWQKSPSRDVAMEIAEFAYRDQARLFVREGGNAKATDAVSSGELWHTGSIWKWRIWSVSQHGDVAFSESRPFSN